MLELKKINYLSSIDFVKNRLNGTTYFANLLSKKLQFDIGEFYMLVPVDLDEQIIYDFDIGGYIYPFKRENNQTVVKTKNIADEILGSLTFQYNQLSDSNCLGIEDFAAEVHYPFVKSTNRRYSLIENRLFYLIDNEFSLEETAQYIKWSKSWISLGLFLKLNIEDKNLIKGNLYKSITSESVINIYDGIKSFYLEIHDGETYLFWISKEDENILSLLRNLIVNHNEMNYLSK